MVYKHVRNQRQQQKKSSDEPDKKKQTDFTGIIQYSGKQMRGVT